MSFERKVAFRTELSARSLESVPLMFLFGAIVCCMLPKLLLKPRLCYMSALHNVGGAMIPWTKALVVDLAALKRAAPKKLEELPPCEADH